MTTDRISVNIPADLDPNGLVTLPEFIARDHPTALDDVAGVEHDDNVTAVALIDLARHVVADFEETEPTTRKLYTITHIADWEGGVTVYPTHAAAWSAVQTEAETVASDNDRRLPRDPEDWPEFIRDHGWKVIRYDVEEHDVTDTAPDVFAYEPPPIIKCATCGVPIEHDDGDPEDSWTPEAGGGYHCPKTDPNPMGDNARDHAPAKD